MRPAVSLAALALLALAACSKQPAVDAKNATPGEVAGKVAASGLKPLPGKWESHMKIDKLDLPNMPPAMAAQMQKALGTEKVFSTCLTPEQAEHPDAGFFQKDSHGCTYDHFTMADGRIDGKMVCQRPGAGKMELTMAGTYQPDSYAMHTTSTMSGPGAMAMSTSATISSRRVGECDAKAGG